MTRRKRAGKSRRGNAPLSLLTKSGKRFECPTSTSDSSKNESNSTNIPDGTPCSFVIKRGRLTTGPRQLVKDLRLVMSPYCSMKLKERRKNKVRDFIAVSSLLGVTHLQSISQSDNGAIYLKISQLPSGPTITFLVKQFSLMKDIRRRCRGIEDERKGGGFLLKHRSLVCRNDTRDFQHPALLLFSGQKGGGRTRRGGGDDVKNKREKRQDDGFFEMSEGEHTQRRSEGDGEGEKASSHTISERDAEDLITRMIKNVFPPINVQNALLSDCRRVVLYRRDHRQSASSSSPPVTYQFRQYAIVRRAAGITSGVRRLVEASTKAAARRSLLRSLGLREGEKRVGLPYDEEEEEEEEKGVKKELKRDFLAEETLTVKNEAGSVSVKREDNEESESDDGREASSSAEEEEEEEEERKRRVERKRRRRDDICDITLKKEKRTETDSEPEDEEDIIEMDRQAARHAVSRNSKTLSQRRGGDALSALIRSSSCIRRKKAQGGEGDEEKEDGEEGMLEDHENSEENSYTKTCKMAISLIELGPRMELQLVKIEDDVCTGAVLYHNFISKTPEELQQLKEKEASLRAKRQEELDEMERVVEMQLKKRKKNKDGEEEGENTSSTDEEEESTSKGMKTTNNLVRPRSELLSSEKQMLDEFTDQDGNCFYGLKKNEKFLLGKGAQKKKNRDDSSLSEQTATGETADEDTGDEHEEDGESHDENDGDDGLGDSDSSESTEDGGEEEEDERTGRQKFHPFSFKKKKKLSTEGTDEVVHQREKMHSHPPNPKKSFQKKNRKKKGQKSQKGPEGGKGSVNANVMQKYQMAKKAQLLQQQRGG